MEKGIFEGARFGDLFVTRNGHQAVWLGYEYRYKHPKIEVLDFYGGYNPVWDDNGHFKGVRKDEESEWDIIGKGSCDEFYSQLHKSVDEKKLDELAEDYLVKINASQLDLYKKILIKNDFKAGYRKAKEE